MKTAKPRDDSHLATLADMAKARGLQDSREEAEIDFDAVTQRWKERREEELLTLRAWRALVDQRLEALEKDLNKLTVMLNTVMVAVSENTRTLESLTKRQSPTRTHES